MARPLKIHIKSGNTFSFKEMTDVELYNIIILPMLRSYALDTGASALSADNANLLTTYSYVGVVDDVYRYYEVGTHPGGAYATSRQFQILQNLLAETENHTRPITWTNSAIRQMTDAEIDTYIIDPALNYLTAGGVGSYYITRSNTAPTHLGGATWTLIAGYADKITTSTNASDGGYYLWRQINNTVNPVNGGSTTSFYGPVYATGYSGDFSLSSATTLFTGQFVTVTGNGTGITGRPATATYTIASTNGSTQFRLVNTNGSAIATTPGEMINVFFNFGTPLKLNTNLYEMDQATIVFLKNRLKNKILSTQKGTYRLGTVAPSTGTWSAMGTWTDSSRSWSNIAYTGYYAGSYLGSYATGFSGSYNSLYYGGVAAGTWYTGTYNTWYSGYYTGPFPGGSYAGNYVGATVVSTLENNQTINLYVRRS